MIVINRNNLPEPNTTCETCGHKYRICKPCLEMKRRGLEAWRQHCDCIECYQLYIFLNQDLQDISEEEYERAMQIELPDGHELTKENKKKMDEIKKHFQPNNTVIQKVDNTDENSDYIDKQNKFGKGRKFGYNKGR